MDYGESDGIRAAAQNFAHTEDPASAAKAGALGEGLGALGEVAAKPLQYLSDQIQSIAPKVESIAGENVPVAATHPQLGVTPGNESAGSALNINNPENLETATESTVPDAKTPVKDTLQHFSTPQGAQNFVDTQVQPAARKALQATLSQPAVDAVDELRTLRNEPTLEDNPPKLKTTSAIAKFMSGEAKKTYQVLDDAAQHDIDQWTEQYGEQAQKNAVQEGITIPEKPKLFTELQDQINDAKSTIGNKGASQVEKQTAIKDLPIYQKEMQAFMDKHGDLVNPSELKTANSVYSQSKRYDWVAKKLRSATQGAGEGGTFKGDV